MTDALDWPRRPLSVVVIGNSASVMQLPFRERHSEGLYGEVLADRLAERGIPVKLTVHGRWFEFAHTAARRYADDVVPHVPDVLVVNYGAGEMMPWYVPSWLVRHLMRRNESIARTSELYRRHVAERLWSQVKAYRRAVGGRKPSPFAQLSPRRFESSMRLLLRLAERTTRPLVLVMDISPPSPKLNTYLPGIDENYSRFQAIVERVATTSGPNVRLVRTSEVSRELGIEKATPDNLHFSVEGHARAGEMLSAEVLDWLESGCHL